MASSKRDLEEKRKMEEAVAKVREVVHTASKNDIVLALHIYELDIDKTIQAFCDGWHGAQNALGAWERTGVAKKKNRKKKKDATLNSQTASNLHPVAPAKETAKPNRTVRPQYPNNDLSTPTDSTVTYKTAKDFAFQPAGIEQVSSGAALVIEPTHNVNMYKGTDSEEETCSIAISCLKNFEDEVKDVEVAFEQGLLLAEESIKNVFKGIRQLLEDREVHLLAEVNRIHDDGARILTERRVKANELLDRAKRIKAMSDREKQGFRSEIAQFSLERGDEANFTHKSRFVCDNASMIKMVKNFGEVLGVKTTGSAAPLVVTQLAASEAHANEVKMPVGRSSRTSSVGEDSGLGQISPSGEERKHVAEVNDGGILMKSDALTADELAGLNATVRETLKAQGIDATLFSGLTMPVRRRQGGGGRGRPRVPKPAPPLPDPQLSIFE
ncbi:unnamed protein product [Enterobius vermicularis]|uniref:KfrA_N domain-containing protein n=1 Tax=Enterobius vermicularis TaxID=51028 RepID=A0A0N4VE02_ENTVE|nr:unnamed protein product [Enterobius vermicularis]